MVFLTGYLHTVQSSRVARIWLLQLLSLNVPTWVIHLTPRVESKDFLFRCSLGRSWRWLSTWWERSTSSQWGCLRGCPCCREEHTCRSCRQFWPEKWLSGSCCPGFKSHPVQLRCASYISLKLLFSSFWINLFQKELQFQSYHLG